MTVLDSLIISLEHAFYANCVKIPADTDYTTWRWRCQQAIDAISWYVQTGRASGAETYAINDCRMYYLVRHMAMVADDFGTDALIKAMHSYPGFVKRINARTQR